MDWIDLTIAIVGGFFAGIINTLAGNGSAITLTILTEVLGLSGNLANGTNRIGVAFQAMASSYGFYEGGKLKIKENLTYIIAIVVGAVIGVIIAVNVSNEAFKSFFKYMMIVMLVVILVKPKRWLQETDIANRPSDVILLPLFVLLGIYGGFIQMGMGVIFLVVTVLLAKFNILEANAIKAFVVAVYSVLVIAIFQYNGLIDWRIGGIIAIGQTLGGYLTARFASSYPKANVWAHRLLVFVVVLSIIRLFGGWKAIKSCFFWLFL